MSLCDTLAGANEFEVRATMDRTCEFRSIRAFLVIQNLAEIGKVVSTVPDMKDIESEKIDFDVTIVLSTDKDAREVERKAMGVAEIATVQVTPRATKVPGEKKDAQAAPKPGKEGKGGKDNKAIHSVRIDIDRLDTIMNLVGELVISRGRLFEISHRRRPHGDERDHDHARPFHHGPAERGHAHQDAAG